VSARPVDAAGGGVQPLIARLMAQLTADEKIGLTACASAAVPRLGLMRYDHWTEALHGAVSPGGPDTVYPMPIALAASFNTALVARIGQQVASAAHQGHLQARQRTGGDGGTGMSEGLTLFSPNINLLRDPRWGRGQETYGEDPWLTSQLGVAMIRGLQADGLCCATAKHFAVHSGPEPLRFHFDAQVSAHDLHDSYLPAFRAAVVQGQVGALMTAYNAVNGQPLSAHADWLNGLLRQQWGFEGVVVSDCNALRNLATDHHCADDAAQAVALALRSGVDLELYAGAQSPAQAYRDALQRGLLTEADLDRALRRTLALRARLGVLQTDAAAGAAAPATAAETAAHHATALQAAQESLVLLHNNGLLPLRAAAAGRPCRIAVVGPLADDPEVMLGNYNGRPANVVTVLQGLRQQFAGAQITHARGANLPLTPVDVPPECLSTDDGQPGLHAQLWPGVGPGGEPVAQRLDAAAHWVGRAGQGFTRWTGWLTPTVSGRYQLGSSGTGGSRVLIDGQLLTDDATLHAPRDQLGQITLQAGRRYRLQMEVLGIPAGWCRLVWWREAPDALAQALAACDGADLVVAVLGLNGRLEGEDLATDLPGFQRGDRVSLGLPDEQQQLLQALQATGLPLVTVLLSGSALAVPPPPGPQPAATLQAFYPGQAGGTAVAQVLAGAINPAGRLPVTVYRDAAQLPPFEHYGMAGRTYRHFSGEPLYRFGHGLSYTRFAYSLPPAVAADLPLALDAGQTLQLRVQLHNTGALAGDEVAQLYLQCPGWPRWALRGVQRQHLAAGQSMRLQFTLDARALSSVDADGARWVEPGRYRLWIGGGQPNGDAPGVWDELYITGRLALPT